MSNGKTIDTRIAIAKNWNATTIPRGISLFLPVPLFRDCYSAKIPLQWCVCNTQIRLPTNYPQVLQAASTLVQNMNSMMKKYSQCYPLALESVTYAGQITNDKKQTVYDLSIVTKPGLGKFQSVVYRKDGDRNWTISDTVSRLNSYGNQTDCVDDGKIKHMCYC